MTETLSLAGKRVIVTGAARGIGASAVRALSAAGAQVSAFDLAEDVDFHGTATYAACDVSDRAQTVAAFDDAASRMGGLDALVHSAGIQQYISAEAITDADWDLVVGVNARGTMITNQAAFTHMKAGGGRIINFASAAGALGLRGCAHYAASKGAVLAWTRTVAQEWAQYGIRANAIAPGMSTPMNDATRARLNPEQLAAYDEKMAQVIPLGGKLGDPDTDLSPVLVFLIGDGAHFITGQTLAVDGGLMMVR